ncbi:MAG: bifunctional diaminohydroxyphosphoribosylaminopyrimidine deaminase/5-amino-6-(5-phosphoribosylamino)uracil reductase RibD [Lysobacterales bacterium]
MSFSAFDYECMASALRLARKGQETTHPNPRVGCVISRDGQVVGTGWHKKAGEPHAEIYALREAGDKAAGGTAYVTLEPCSHMGRTPPCVDALVDAKVARVVFAIGDPNPDVNGNGVQRLQQAGIEVHGGLLAAQAEELNAGFLKRMRQQRPWVRIKLAQSIDGHVALANGSSQWISSPESRADVQRWRARSDGILTGIGTVLADDPSLNARNNGADNQPARIVIDSHWRTPPDARLLGLPGKVLIAGLDERPVPEALRRTGADILGMPAFEGRVDMSAVLTELARRGFNEIQVEAGATLCGTLVLRGLADELLVYQAPSILGGSAMSPFAFPGLDNMNDRVHLEWVDSRRVGQDLRLRLTLGVNQTCLQES